MSCFQAAVPPARPKPGSKPRRALRGHRGRRRRTSRSPRARAPGTPLSPSLLLGRCRAGGTGAVPEPGHSSSPDPATANRPLGKPKKAILFFFFPPPGAGVHVAARLPRRSQVLALPLEARGTRRWEQPRGLGRRRTCPRRRAAAEPACRPVPAGSKGPTPSPSCCHRYGRCQQKSPIFSPQVFQGFGDFWDEARKKQPALF